MVTDAQRASSTAARDVPADAVGASAYPRSRGGLGRWCVWTAIIAALVAGQYWHTLECTRALRSRIDAVAAQRRDGAAQLQALAQRDQRRASALQTLRAQMAALRAELTAFTAAAHTLRAELAQQHDHLQTLDHAVTTLQRTQRRSSRAALAHHASPPQTAVATAVPVLPAAPDFVLAGIDAFGGRDFVVTRSHSGAWVSLIEGDRYDGWQLVTVDGAGRRAAFERGGERCWLTVR